MSHTIDPKPDILHYEGTLPTARLPSVAIVGSRKPTAYGLEVAYDFAASLARAGLVIISGLAIGIDAVAHQAALDAGGRTIAILGGGLAALHPRRNLSLAAAIVESGGAIISEYEDRQPALAHQFLERNRLISGLADVVVIIEAAKRSGTLSTASWGLQQGKTVMAVPGNITSSQSVGCNRLLQSGALLATQPGDVIEALGLRAPASTQTSLVEGSTDEQAILRLLQRGIRDGNELQQKSRLPPATFQQTLTLLEISGKIRALGANQWCLRP